MNAWISLPLASFLFISCTSLALGYGPDSLSGLLSDPLSEHELNAVRVSHPVPRRAREDWCPRYLQAVFLSPTTRQAGGPPEDFPDPQGSVRAVGLVAIGELFAEGTRFPADQAVVDDMCYEVRLVSDVFEPEEASFEGESSGVTTREMAFPDQDLFLPRFNPALESAFFLSPLVGVSGSFSIFSTNQAIPFSGSTCIIGTVPNF